MEEVYKKKKKQHLPKKSPDAYSGLKILIPSTKALQLCFKPRSGGLRSSRLSLAHWCLSRRPCCRESPVNRLPSFLLRAVVAQNYYAFREILTGVPLYSRPMMGGGRRVVVVGRRGITTTTDLSAPPSRKKPPLAFKLKSNFTC